MIWVDTLVQGILLGGLYALFAAGLSLVFGIMRLVNLAHGDMIVMAAYLILGVMNLLGLHPFVAVLIAAPLMFAVGWALQTYVLGLRLPFYFWLGLRGFAGALAWLIVPAGILFAATRAPVGGAVALVLLGYVVPSFAAV